MSRKILSVVLALVLSFSTVLSVCAVAVDTTTGGNLVSDIKDDVSTLKNSIKRIKALSKSLSNDI